MQKEFFENFKKMTELTLENYKKLGETNLLLGQKLLKEQAELTNALLEKASLETEIPTDIKDLKDFTAKQAELAQASAKQVVESSRVCADIIAEAGKTYNDIFEKSLKAAGEGAACCATKTKSSKAA